MFVLTDEEFAALRSQSATSNVKRGGRRYAPRVFTERGALMAATVLSSTRAIETSVYVVRAFVQLRELAVSHQDLSKRLDDLVQQARKLAAQHDAFSRNTRNQLQHVFDTLRELMAPPNTPRRPIPIGFVVHEDKKPKAER